MDACATHGSHSVASPPDLGARAEAEQSLIGQPLTETSARHAGELAFRGARTRPLNAFKVPLGVNTVVEALMIAQQRA